jgi:ATP-dependent helicase/nuclease subunit A
MKAARHALVEAGPRLAGIQDPGDLSGLYDYLVPLTRLTGGSTGGHKEFVKSGVEQLQILLSGGLAPILGEATLALLSRLDQIFRGIKARAGGLDFADLQFAVGGLLKSNPSIVVKLRSRYKTYMIDEFQDTDRLQHRIIGLLVEEEKQIPPGRLFVVGDEKQSIYRFRGAEVRVFDELRQQLTKTNPRREKRITCNYRSRQPLIDLVNALFNQLMDRSQGSEIDYINLTANRAGQGPCAELINCSPQEDGEAIHEAEARIMSARIREMVAGGQNLSLDQEGNPRPVKYGDIAILPGDKPM